MTESRLSGHLADVVVSVLDTGNVRVLGQVSNGIRVHVQTRHDGGVRVDENRDGGGVGELHLSREFEHAPDAKRKVWQLTSS